MKVLTSIIFLLLIFDSSICNAEPNDFFNDLRQTSEELKGNHFQWIKESLKEKLDKSGDEILDIQDVGTRYLCACYDYIVKIRQKSSGNVHAYLYSVHGGTAKRIDT